MDHKDHIRLSEIFQEIMDEFSEMKPTSLDRLEDRVLDAIQKLGSCLMDTKLRDWNNEVYQERDETCGECGTRLHHKQKKRQIATWVCDVNYSRYRSYCPECKQAEYPLDRILEIRPRQRMSSSVEELSVLCGASWKYEQSEYIMEKVLGRRCVSHETIFNKTREIGEAASLESEGARIKELDGDKLQQGEYFDNMEVEARTEDPAERIYMDLDGVMINSRDNAERMEGKVAIVWSKRELVKSDAHRDTYSLVDKRYMGSFSDPERYYWEITAELYRRSGGRMDDVQSLVRGDGAPFIHSFHSKYAPRSRYILDYYHMCRKVRKRLSAVYEKKKKRREEVGKTILKYLDSGHVDSALEYIHKLIKRFRKRRKIEHLQKLAGYIERNRHGIWYDEAREQGISIGAGSADKAGDIPICRRMKLRGMRWSRRGADAALAIRILVYNGEWDEFWQRHKAA